MINWSIEKRKIKDLKDHKKNPRKISSEDQQQLKKSLEKFGIIDKICINQDGTIIGGHQRKKTFKAIGIKEVDCYIPDRLLTEEEVDELNIRLNRNTGEWDYDILANQWDPASLIEWGFSCEDLFNAPAEEIAALEDEEDGTLSPGDDKDAITQPGDLFELGDHRIICGDSTMPDIVQKLLGSDIPILMVTDPPYGVEYDPSWRKDIKEKHRVAAKALGKVQNDGQVNWSLAWHLFPGSVAYVWHAGNFGSEVQKSLEEAEYEIISQIIWVKQHFALSRGDYHWHHEASWYAIKKGHSHNWQGSRKESTVWEIASLNAFGGKSADGDERTAHSTQKPLECMARPIKNNSQKGDYVYDPFLGSGTTLIAAEKLDRKCLGIELSPAYCDIIIKRWIKERTKNGKEAIVKRNETIITEFV